MIEGSFERYYSSFDKAIPLKELPEYLFVGKEDD